MPHYLSQQLCGATVLNEGVGGARSDQLLKGTDGKHQPWLEEVKRTPATIILLNYGINDTYRGTESIAAYKKTMLQLVKIAKAAGKKVFLQTPNPVYVSSIAQEPDEPLMTLAPELTGYLSYKRHRALQQRVEVIRELARTEKLPLIDANKVMLRLTQKIPLDQAYIGVHPRPVGYEAIATEAAKTIVRHMGLE